MVKGVVLFSYELLSSSTNSSSILISNLVLSAYPGVLSLLQDEPPQNWFKAVEAPLLPAPPTQNITRPSFATIDRQIDRSIVSPPGEHNSYISLY